VTSPKAGPKSNWQESRSEVLPPKVVATDWRVVRWVISSSRITLPSIINLASREVDIRELINQELTISIPSRLELLGGKLFEGLGIERRFEQLGQGCKLTSAACM
jgi:hypothetical protein